MLNLPDKPGVYLFKDSLECVIYVGKAKSLKKRVSSYFLDSNKNHKVKALVKNHNTIDYIITNTEREALILENNLIKKYRPRFNVLLKDDKSYPFIVVTDEDFPRICKVKRLKGKYKFIFGPYIKNKNINAFLDNINSFFKLRTCFKLKKRKCLRYDIDYCSAPCEKKINKENYLNNVEKVISILKGNSFAFLKIVKNRMLECSQSENFEKAAYYRDIIDIVNEFKKDQITQENIKKDFDIISFYNDEQSINISIGIYISGKLNEVKSYLYDYIDIQSVFVSFLIHHYKNYSYRKKVYLDKDSYSMIKDFLDILNCDVQLSKIGKKKKMLELINANSKMKLRDSRQLLYSMQKKLQLNNIPYRIECYDISNISGDYAVGSMVVFLNGTPANKQYRKFNIKTVKGSNDFAMLIEVIKRRFSHEDWDVPDMVLIDGGKGQISSVNQFIPIGIDVRSIAKKEEIIYNSEFNEFKLTKDDVVLKTLQYLRDESHRFAISHYRKTHENNLFGNDLQKIKGVGKNSIFKLMKNFDSYDSIKKATIIELENVLNKRQAMLIWNFFNK